MKEKEPDEEEIEKESEEEEERYIQFGSVDEEEETPEEEEDEPEIQEEEEEIVEPPEEEFEIEEEEIVEPPEEEEEEEPEIEEEEEIEDDLHYKAKDIQLSEKYKKQKEIFEKFGPEGMKLYSMFTFETTIKNAIEMTKIDKEKGEKIIDYLIDEELIESTGEKLPKTKKKKEKKIENQEEDEEEIEGEEEERERNDDNFAEVKIYSDEEKPPVETKTQIYERKLREKFGEKGVKIYRLIDGRKNAEQIMKEVGVNEDTIIKVFEFMEKEGMIKLDHPGSKSKSQAVEEKKIKEETKRKMEPMSDMGTSSTKKIMIDDKIPIDVPIIKKQSLPDKMALEAKLLARFGGKSLRINTKMNDEKDVVSLAIEMGISLDELDEILYSISNAGGCTFATLSNEDIKKRYGSEAFELYEEFGRDGIMLYELIGKMNIMDIIKFTGLDARKAAKIIHKANLLLGIDDIDEETIYKSIKDVK